MIKIDLINAERVFLLEADRQATHIHNSFETKEAVARISQVKNKVRHTQEVMRTGSMALDSLNVNQSVKDFSMLALLDHDIGRFLQMRLTGTYNDYDSSLKTGIANHGILGKLVLLGDSLNQYQNIKIDTPLITSQIPDGNLFYNPIAQIVVDHIAKINSDEELKILTTKVFQDYSAEEILKMDKKTVKSALAAITQLVQDADRLDIYYQVINGIWSPAIADEPVHPEIIEAFYRGEYIDIGKCKQKGIWNNNAGDLVRLSFINQIKLLSIAKIILQENLIMRLKTARANPYVDEAFDYTDELLRNLVKNSEDGVTLTKKRT